MLRFTTALLFLFGFGLTHVQAQDQAFVFGDEYLCIGQCGTWFVEFPTGDDFIYVWEFTDGNIPNPTVFESIQTTGVESVTWCPNGIAGSG